MAIVLIIIGTIFWILVDEVMMSICQRRIGPLNIGWYGLLSAIINGLNLVLTNSIVPVITMSSHIRFIIMMILFFGCSLIPAYFLYPFLIVDSTMSAFVIFIPIFISLFSLIFVSIYGSSKYSLLGSLRLISQFIGTELVFTSLLLILVWAYFMWSVGQFLVQLQSFQTILSLWFILATIICILAESNRVPFDIPEAESELVAGFLTEISSIYFSILILAEYSSIIALTFFLIMAFHLVPGILVIILSFFSLVRSSLARLKYDEYQILFWLYIIPILFAFLLLSLIFV